MWRVHRMYPTGLLLQRLLLRGTPATSTDTAAAAVLPGHYCACTMLGCTAVPGCDSMFSAGPRCSTPPSCKNGCWNPLTASPLLAPASSGFRPRPQTAHHQGLHKRQPTRLVYCSEYHMVWIHQRERTTCNFTNGTQLHVPDGPLDCPPPPGSLPQTLRVC